MYYYFAGAVFALVLVGIIAYVIYKYGRKAKFTHMSAIGSLFMEGDDTELFSEGTDEDVQLASLTSESDL